MHNTDYLNNNLDFTFRMDHAFFETLPQSLIGTADISKQNQHLLRDVLDLYPQIIIISTKASLSRIANWLSQLKVQITLMALHIGLATFVALMAISAIILREERYSIAIKAVNGASKIMIIKTNLSKFLFLGALSFAFSCVALFLFHRFALSGFIPFGLNLSWSKILIICAITAILGALMPIVLILIQGAKAAKIDEYSQDFNKVELDF